MDLMWKSFIKEQEVASYYSKLMGFVDLEYERHTVYPAKENIYRAMELTSYKDVLCVIIGQDPYFNPGEAQGLAFSVPDSVKRPPSLRNIYKELADDLGVERTTSDLTDWAKKGVLLLNRVLTVRGGIPNSHKDSGWLEFTKNLIKYLSTRSEPMVFMLWGGEARKLKTIIDKKHCIIESPHPSPLSSYRGFFGSKPFSRCNEFLKHYNKEINWGDV